MQTPRFDLLLALQEREELPPELAELITQVLFVMGAPQPPSWRQFAQACRVIELVLVAALEDPARPVH